MFALDYHPTCMVHWSSLIIHFCSKMIKPTMICLCTAVAFQITFSKVICHQIHLDHK